MQVFTPPNTVMGRALAERACKLVQEAAQPVTSEAEIKFDLVHSAAVDLPAVIRNAAKAALDRGETHYTTRPGIVELRSAIAERVSSAGIAVTTDDVVVTNGGVEALFIAMETLITGSDPIHIAGIAPDSVHRMVRFLGGKPTEIQGTEDNRFLPTPEAIAATEASTLIIQSPNPLTGASYARGELSAIFAAARKSGTTVVLDQSVSSNLVSNQNEEPLQTGDDLKLITIGSFSSEYGMGGWRIGWFTASSAHIKSMSGFKQTLSICTTAVSQFAALAALEETGDWLSQRREQNKSARQAAADLFAQAGIPGIDTNESSYVLVKIANGSVDDRKVRDALLADSGILVEAGSDLHESLSGFIRVNVSAANSLEGIREVANILKRRES